MGRNAAELIASAIRNRIVATNPMKASAAKGCIRTVLDSFLSQGIITAHGDIRASVTREHLLVPVSDLAPSAWPGDMHRSSTGELGLLVQVDGDGHGAFLRSASTGAQNITVNVSAMVVPTVPVDSIRICVKVNT
jgi:hypothetical protein